MLDLLSNIVDLLVDFFTAIGSLLSDLFDVIVKVGRAASFIPDLFSWLPRSVSAILISTFAVVVVYKVLGREG